MATMRAGGPAAMLATGQWAKVGRKHYKHAKGPEIVYDPNRWLWIIRGGHADGEGYTTLSNAAWTVEGQWRPGTRGAEWEATERVRSAPLASSLVNPRRRGNPADPPHNKWYRRGGHWFFSTPTAFFQIEPQGNGTWFAYGHRRADGSTIGQFARGTLADAKADVETMAHKRNPRSRSRHLIEPRRKTIRHKGQDYHWTGKMGTHFATGRGSAEYATPDDARLWAFSDTGVVSEDDTGGVGRYRRKRS